MKKVKLRFRQALASNHDIVIGSGVLTEVGPLSAFLGPGRALVIADRRLGREATGLQRNLTASGWHVASILLTAGEPIKDLRRLPQLYRKLTEIEADRTSVIFALGGGTVGDIAGFVAGTYLRGIRWVGIPSTLLAQVDSSIGGKTGVNLASGKNLVGVIHQPSLVLCDTDLLRRLSRRDRVSGLGEILKYGLTFDRHLWDYLAENYQALLNLDKPVVNRVVAQCARWKAQVVVKDEYETHGLRQVLNFGHTFGHALESATDYRHFRHGEAVLWGMRFAAALSAERGHLADRTALAIEERLSRIPIPTIPPRLRLEGLLEYVKRDKKARAGRIGFVLLERIGKALLDYDVTPGDLRRAFRRICP